MDYQLFYEKTYAYLVGKTAKFGLNEEELNAYFAPTVSDGVEGDDGVNDLRRLFLRMCFHGQNGSMISGVINFNRNYEILNEFTCNFNVFGFLNRFPTPEEASTYLTEKLVLRSGKTEMVAAYGRRVFSFASFISGYDSYESFVQEMLRYEIFAPKYISINVEGMSVLAFDFLKELDPRFDLCKPDIHVTEVIKALGLVRKSADPLLVSKAVSDLAARISNALGSHVSAYKLDKILYLICSENFYLHNGRKNFTDEKRVQYLSFILPIVGTQRR